MAHNLWTTRGYLAQLRAQHGRCVVCGKRRELHVPHGVEEPEVLTCLGCSFGHVGDDSRQRGWGGGE